MKKRSRFNLPIPFGWFGVAFSDQLQPGDVKALSYFDRDLALFRTESGAAKVIDAICPHLGAHIGVGGIVHGESVACPFHGWKFNGEGYCTEVPYAKRMPPRVDGVRCITPYPTVEKNGVVWVWYHPDGAAPSFEVEELPEFSSDQWTKPYIREWTIHCPIQEAAENAVDKAHFAYVHGAESVPEGEVTIDGCRRVTELVSRIPALDEQGQRKLDGEWVTSYLTTVGIGPGQTWQRFRGIFETVMMGVVTPIDAETLQLRFVFTQPRQQSELEAMAAQGFMQEICRQVEQDIPIWNHKHYQPNPILCDGDGPIAQYRKWFSQFYAQPIEVTA